MCGTTSDGLWVPKAEIIMIIESIEGGYDNNFTYLVGCEKSHIGAVIDAAVGAEQILKRANEVGLDLQYLVITHSHHDHYSSAEPLMRKLDNMTLVMYGNAVKNIGEANRLEVNDNDTFHIGSLEVQVMHTPGHYPDSICLVTDGAVFTGDTLFIGRTGRTISPKSDTDKLYHSVTNKILKLPEDTIIYPGHNYGGKPFATLREERETNPFLQAENAEEFVEIMDEYERSLARGM